MTCELKLDFVRLSYTVLIVLFYCVDEIRNGEGCGGRGGRDSRDGRGDRGRWRLEDFIGSSLYGNSIVVLGNSLH